MKWVVLFIWIELIIVFATGCSSPRDKRGDWMEHLEGRTYEPIDWWSRRGAWYRNYRTREELHEEWSKIHKEAIDILNIKIEDHEKRLKELDALE